MRVSPGVIPELKEVHSQRLTPYGRVSFAWSYSNGKYTQELTLPVGTTAVLHTPHSIAGRSLYSVKDTSGTSTLEHTLWTSGGSSDSERLKHPVGVLTVQDGVDSVEVVVGSGVYHLESEYGY